MTSALLYEESGSDRICRHAEEQVAEDAQPVARNG